MKRLILVPAALGLLAACDAKTVAVETNPNRATYSRDARTNLCFASFGRSRAGNVVGNAESFSVTNVPCSAEVLALVPRAQGGHNGG
jgi:hypothetical protein